jgi:transposase InsO family protein
VTLAPDWLDPRISRSSRVADASWFGYESLSSCDTSTSKTELIRRRGPWRGLDQVEMATLEWVDWFNNRRLHSACGDVPPAEYEQQHYRQNAAPRTLEAAEPSLH